MSLVVFITLILIILVELSYLLVGRRQKIIDQFESDVRIFLVLVLVISFYLLLSSISFIYFKLFIQTDQLKYAVLSIYFLFPPFLGVILYAILPWLYGRNLHLKDTRTPDAVEKISHLLNIPVLPRVKTTPLKISPLVYGRRGKTSIFVLPDMSFLTEEEQKAVIAHELSHIKQGDVGFFTWLTLLIEGFKYWIIPLLLVVYLGPVHLYFFNPENAAFIILIPLFFVSLILLKNSLSRTRESIADAYVIFHGLKTPLKSAVYKYAALKPQSSKLKMWFHHESPILKPILSTHPPLLKRLQNIEEKTFLTETITNLSTELALWTGIASAFLFYALYRTGINFSAVFDYFMSDSASFIFLSILFLATANVVAASYVFPVTKASALFLDFGQKPFLLPLVRNLILTAGAAVAISYGLTFDVEYTWLCTAAVLGGFLLWVMGFASARESDFSHGEEYLVLNPVFWFFIFWYPLKSVHSFLQAPSDILFFLTSMLSILLLSLGIILVLMEKGQLLMDRNERILMLFNKKKEFPRTNDFTFIFLVLIMLLVPAVISFGAYIVSCLFDIFGIIPVRNIIIYSTIFILLVYGLKESDILFFSKIFFLLDIISSEKEIDEKDSQFVQKIIKNYQSSDGGFDYAGVGFSNQKDTFYFVKTAKILGIQLNDEKVTEWIDTTEKKGGFALFAGGTPRVKGLYYAVQSLLLLNQKRNMSHHVQWILTAFNGEYFDFKDDTDSLLLQTCYAVELLNLLPVVHTADLNPCKKWIESHFSENLKSEEAFLVIRALKVLNSDVILERWVDKNVQLLSTRLDKNLEAIYSYVKVLEELNQKTPPLIVEQAVQEMAETRREYKNKELKKR